MSENEYQQAETDHGFIRNDCNIFRGRQDDMPLSFRAYEPLETVNEKAIAGAHSVTDVHDGTVLPIGGLLHMGYFTEEGEIVIDDLAAVPTKAAVGALDQFPLIVRERPGNEHDPAQISDFGRYPTINDLENELDNPPVKAEEMVLAIPANPLIERLLDNDLAAAAQIEETPILADLFYNSLHYVRRAWCEEDRRFLQILPYMVYYKVIDGEYHIFAYQRGKGVGEQRLAGGTSIGIGGHINIQDFLQQTQTRLYTKPRVLSDGFWGGIKRNIYRESDEEVTCFDDQGQQRFPLQANLIAHEEKTGEELGWLYRNSTFFLDYSAGNVEKVHLAMFIGVEVPADMQIETAEMELVDVGFVPLSQLVKGEGVPSELECWSKSIIDSLASTMKFVKDNNVGFPSAAFVRDASFHMGQHFINSEQLALVPPQDRWKIGTISSIFSVKYQFYGMNVFMKV